jgi:hypothetical protein
MENTNFIKSLISDLGYNLRNQEVATIYEDSVVFSYQCADKKALTRFIIKRLESLK